VVITCRRASGARYRRLECSDCTHRWSISAPEGEPVPRPSLVGHGRRTARRMTDREAALIILSYDSLHEIARRTGFSYGTVYEIKHGRSYHDVHRILQPILDND